MNRAAVIAMGLMLSAAPALAQERMGPERSVSTMGQASVKMAPDRAYVTIGIEARAPKPADAQRQAAKTMQAVHAKLAALGIPKEGIRTVAFNLQEDWDYTGRTRVRRGYIVSNHIQVTVDNLDKLSDVLDGSIASGANAIHGVMWDLQQRDKVERDALRRAVEDAKLRADVAVTAAGAKLGGVLRINEQRFDSPRPVDMRMMREVAASAPPPPAPETIISPGEIEIRASVNVAFSIVG